MCRVPGRVLEKGPCYSLSCRVKLQVRVEVSLTVELSARREVCEDCTPTFKPHWANEGCEVVKAVEVQNKTWLGR